jgi:peptide/nickel transport system substrate-binding protein
MFRRFTLAAFLCASVSGFALAEEPRQGGTFNFTAPYGSSFATLDTHASPNIQEEFITQAIHRSLYAWDSNNNAPVPELATSVDESAQGREISQRQGPDG